MQLDVLGTLGTLLFLEIKRPQQFSPPIHISVYLISKKK